MGSSSSRPLWAEAGLPPLPQLTSEIVANPSTRALNLAGLHQSLLENEAVRARFKDEIFNIADVYDPASGIHFFFKVVYEYSVNTDAFDVKLKIAQLTAYLLQDSPNLESCAEILIASGVTFALIEFLAYLLHGVPIDIAQGAIDGPHAASPLEVALVLVKFFSYYRSFAARFFDGHGLGLLLDTIVGPTEIAVERRYDALTAIDLLSKWQPMSLVCQPTFAAVLASALQHPAPSVHLAAGSVLALLLDTGSDQQTAANTELLVQCGLVDTICSVLESLTLVPDAQRISMGDKDPHKHIATLLRVLVACTAEDLHRLRFPLSGVSSVVRLINASGASVLATIPTAETTALLVVNNDIKYLSLTIIHSLSIRPEFQNTLIEVGTLQQILTLLAMIGAGNATWIYMHIKITAIRTLKNMLEYAPQLKFPLFRELSFPSLLTHLRVDTFAITNELLHVLEKCVQQPDGGDDEHAGDDSLIKGTNAKPFMGTMVAGAVVMALNRVVQGVTDKETVVDDDRVMLATSLRILAKLALKPDLAEEVLSFLPADSLCTFFRNDNDLNCIQSTAGLVKALEKTPKVAAALKEMELYIVVQREMAKLEAMQIQNRQVLENVQAQQSRQSQMVLAAINIQRVWRGFSARRNLERRLQNERDALALVVNQSTDLDPVSLQQAYVEAKQRVVQIRAQMLQLQHDAIQDKIELEDKANQYVDLLCRQLYLELQKSQLGVRDRAAVKIQKIMRGFLARRWFTTNETNLYAQRDQRRERKARKEEELRKRAVEARVAESTRAIMELQEEEAMHAQQLSKILQKREEMTFQQAHTKRVHALDLRRLRNEEEHDRDLLITEERSAKETLDRFALWDKEDAVRRLLDRERKTKDNEEKERTFMEAQRAEAEKRKVQAALDAVEEKIRQDLEREILNFSSAQAQASGAGLGARFSTPTPVVHPFAPSPQPLVAGPTGGPSPTALFGGGMSLAPFSASAAPGTVGRFTPIPAPSRDRAFGTSMQWQPSSIDASSMFESDLRKSLEHREAMLTAEKAARGMALQQAFAEHRRHDEAWTLDQQLQEECIRVELREEAERQRLVEEQRTRRWEWELRIKQDLQRIDRKKAEEDRVRLTEQARQEDEQYRQQQEREHAEWIKKWEAVRDARLAAEQQRIEATGTIQRAWRSHTARQETNSRMQARWKKKQNQAATRIEKWVRGCLTRQRLARQQRAARSIQWFVLRKLKRAKTRLRAALVIQRHWRGFTARSEILGAKMAHTGAAAPQSRFPSVWRNRPTNFEDILIRLGREDHVNAANLIQRVCRGYLSRRNIFIMLEERGAATQIQRIWRGVAGRREVEVVKEKRVQEAREIERRRMQHMAEQDRHQRMRNKAATTISRVVRGSNVRANLTLQRVAIIRIQSVVRRMLASIRVRRLRREAEKREKKRLELLEKQRLEAEEEEKERLRKQHQDELLEMRRKTMEQQQPLEDQPLPSSRGDPAALKDTTALSDEQGGADSSSVQGSVTRGARPKLKKKDQSVADGLGGRQERQVLRKIQELEEAGAKFESEGNLKDALDQYYLALDSRRAHYGPESPTLNDAILKIAEVQNALAQEQIQRNVHGEATILLTKTDMLTNKLFNPDERQNVRRQVIRAKMYNHWCCLRKAQGNIRAALKFMEKSLSVLLQMNLIDQLPTCYLNICALYSSLGLHAEALRHAFMALQVVKELITLTTKVDVADLRSGKLSDDLERMLSKETAEMLEMGGLKAMLDSDAWQGNKEDRLKQFGTQLAITYFNIAVEQEYLSDQSAYLRTYEVALLTAQEYLGEEDPLTVKFRKMLTKVQRQRAQIEKSALAASPPPPVARAFERSRQAVATTAAVPSLYSTVMSPGKGKRGGGRRGGPKKPSANVIAGPGRAASVDALEAEIPKSSGALPYLAAQPPGSYMPTPNSINNTPYGTRLPPIASSGYRPASEPPHQTQAMMYSPPPMDPQPPPARPLFP